MINDRDRQNIWQEISLLSQWVGEHETEFSQDTYTLLVGRIKKLLSVVVGVDNVPDPY